MKDLSTTTGVEDRPGVIAADGMPPEITYVWDPVSDTVVAAFKAGSNNGAAGGGSVDSNGGLLRQWIHGGLGYDDPVETTVMAGTAVDRLYPFYDEAGAGNLQVLLNRNAEVVSRNVVNDPYVAQDLTVGGAAVDRIASEAKRKETSELESVAISVRITEDVAPDTVANGMRLAVLRSDGSVVRTSSSVPQISEAESHTLRWNLTAADWATLVAADGSTAPAILSIAVTKDLRASTWAADVPVLPAPDWATQTKPLFTSSDYPVESRESLAALSSFLATIPAGTTKSETIYEVETLSLLGSSDPVSDIPALLTSTFQAHPLTSRLGNLDYVRARWLHRESGTWVTPDPLGNRDSSNVYAFAGGDPVNGRDPSGRYQLDIHFYEIYYLARATGFTREDSKTIAWSSQFVDSANESRPAPSGVSDWRGVRNAYLTHDVALLHFAAPKHALVEENNVFARGAARLAIKSRDLARFGISLHTYADSYSHSGFTMDTDERNMRTGSPRPNKGHADAEEGGNAPDLPYLDIDKGMRMTSGVLTLLREEYQSRYGRPAPAIDPRALNEDVEAALATRSEREDLRAAYWQGLISLRFGDKAQYEVNEPPMTMNKWHDALEAQVNTLSSLTEHHVNSYDLLPESELMDELRK